MIDISLNTLTPTGAMTTSNLADLMARVVWAEDYGAVGDAVISTNGTLYSATGTDNGPAIQRAIAALGTNGGIVRLQARKYLVKTAITLNTGPVIIEGSSCQQGYLANQNGGTWIIQESSTAVTGFHLFTIGGTYTSTTNPASAGNGSGFRRLGFFQCHPDPGAGTAAWTPAAYDYVISVQNTLGMFTVDEVYFGGINKGIYAFGCGHFFLGQTYIHGQFLTNGVTIGDCEDTPYLGTMRHWCYEYTNANVLAYTQSNLYLLSMGRVDGIVVGNIFCYNAYCAVYCYQEAAITGQMNSNADTQGGCAEGSIGVLSCDNTARGFWVDQCTNTSPAGAGQPIEWQIGICNFDPFSFDGSGTNGSLSTAIAIYITSTSANVNFFQIGTINLYGYAGSAIYIRGNANTLQIANLIANSINKNSTDKLPVIDVGDNSGKNKINHCSVAGEAFIYNSGNSGNTPLFASGVGAPFSVSSYTGNGTYSITNIVSDTGALKSDASLAYSVVYVYGGAQVIKNAFTIVALPSINDDINSNFSTVTNLYTAPVAGVYEFYSTIRINDGTAAGINYGQGVDTTPRDSNSFVWSVTDGSRNGSQATRTMRLTKGQTVSLFVYAENGTTGLMIEQAELVAYLLPM